MTDQAVECIDRDLCRQTAPNNITRDEKRGHSFIFKQSETPEEENQCQEAMQNCPEEAIGDDGELVTKSESARVAVNER